jgi:hypothetical protein
MANQEHHDILRQGVDVWNNWRREHPEIRPDLSEADLSKAKLSRANLRGARLRRANLRGANLIGADLAGTYLAGADFSEADLSGVNFIEANLIKANLTRANLSIADFSGADLGEANLIKANLTRANLSITDLSGADLGEANLEGANLTRARLVETNLTRATLTACSIYGISAWNVELEGATQDSLVITPDDEPVITVDNLKIAQFIYLLLNNAEIRDVIDTITSKVVLILGRFTSERKAVLDALKDELRKHNYSPILFDFEKPANRDLTETVSTLAHLARFIIVDLTDPSSAPHEVATIIPHCIVPVQPLLLQDDAQPRHEYAMFHDLRARYDWVLPTYRYKELGDLLASLQERVIAPAEKKAQELTKR